MSLRVIQKVATSEIREKAGFYGVPKKGYEALKVDFHIETTVENNVIQVVKENQDNVFQIVDNV